MSIKPLNNHYSMVTPASVYDEEAMTALELAGRTAGKVNEIVEAVNAQDEKIETRLSSIENEQVPAAVENQFNENINDGTFNRMIEKHAGELTARVDNLENNYVPGSTTADAELFDIRLKANGHAAATAGASVRGQFKNIEDALFGDYVPLKPRSNLLTIRENSSYNNGTWYDGTATSEYVTLHGDASIYIEQTGSNSLLRVSLLKNDVNGEFIATYDIAALPTATSPLHIPAETCLVISYQQGNFIVHHNSEALGYKTPKQMRVSDEEAKRLTENLNTFVNRASDANAFTAVNSNYDGFTTEAGYIDAAGDLMVDPSINYVTYGVTPANDCKCYMKTNGAIYLSLSHFRDGAFLARYRDETMVTEANPIDVKAGDVLKVTCRSTSASFELYTNNNAILMSMGNDFRLNTAQKNEIDAQISAGLSSGINGGYIRYVGASGGNEFNRVESLYIYLPTKLGYIRYELSHVVDAASNADNWRLQKIYLCDGNFEPTMQITTAGEYEMAIQLEGRADFIGGSLHGDEKLTGISVFVDGRVTAINSLSELTRFSNLRIVESTNMYDPANSVTHVAVHGKEYTFDHRGLTLRQLIEWKGTYKIIQSYMTMFPVIRGNDSISSKQITDAYYCDGDYKVYDVKSTTSAGYVKHKNAKKACIYGDTSGVFATVTVNEYPKLMTGGTTFFVSDSATYNKLYFGILPEAESYNTTAGERWVSETNFDIFVRGDI